MNASGPWFTPLAQEYAKRFTELEFARQRFDSERDRVLEHLVRRASAAKHAGTWRKEAPQRRMLFVEDSGWAKFQKERGHPNMVAGCALTVGDAQSFSDTGECVFVAQAFFGAASDVAEKGFHLKVEGCQSIASNFGYLRFARLVACFGTDAFGLERFTQAAEDLLPFFVRAQSALITAVTAPG